MALRLPDPKRQTPSLWHYLEAWSTPRAMPPWPTGAAWDQELYPGAKHKAWGREELRELMARRFGAEVSKAFDAPSMSGVRRALAVFCVLHEFGGLYCDASVWPVSPWSVPNACGVAAFRAANGIGWTAIGTRLLWSLPGRPELSRAISGLLQVGKDQSDGDGERAAEWVLGRAMASVMLEKGQAPESDGQWVGESRTVSTDGRVLNVAFVDPDQVLVGLWAPLVGT